MDAFDWLLEARYVLGKYPGKHRLELVHFDRGHIIVSNGALMRVFYSGHDLPPLSMTLEQFDLWRNLGIVSPEAVNQVPDWATLLHRVRDGAKFATYAEYPGGFYEVQLKE